MSYKFNPFTGQLDYFETATSESELNTCFQFFGAVKIKNNGILKVDNNQIACLKLGNDILQEISGVLSVKTNGTAEISDGVLRVGVL